MASLMADARTLAARRIVRVRRRPGAGAPEAAARAPAPITGLFKGLGAAPAVPAAGAGGEDPLAALRRLGAAAGAGAESAEEKRDEEGAEEWTCACGARNAGDAESCAKCWKSRQSATAASGNAQSSTFQMPTFSFGDASVTEQKKDDEKADEKPAAPVFSFGTAPVTEQKKGDEKPAAAPAFSFGVPLTTEPKKEESTGDKWKCPCCETMNDNAKDACSECWVPRPKDDKKKEETKTEAAPVFSFGVPSTTEQKKDDEKKNDEKPAAPVFSFGTTPVTDQKKDEKADEKPSAAPVFSFGVSSTTEQKKDDEKPAAAPAFSFGVPLTTEPKKEENTGDKWKCPCCETMNENTRDSCSECWVPRPKDDKKKEETKTEAAPVVSFGGPSTTEQKKDDEKPAAAPVFSFGTAPVTEQKKDDEKPAAAPAFSFGVPSATEQKKEESTGDKWKCPCCETMNDNAKDTCSECWVPRPKDDKKKEETKPEAAPVFSFGTAPVTEQKKDDEKPAAAPVFSFGVPSTTEQKKDDEKPAAAPVFSFGSALVTEQKKEESTGDKWKCPCCETMNDNGKDVCSECWVPRPKDDKKKDETTTETAPVFSFDVPSATEEKKDEITGDKWKCPCCDTMNDKSAQDCAFCFAAAPKQPPATPSVPDTRRAAVRRPRAPATPSTPAPEPEPTPAAPPARRRRSFVPRARDANDRCDVQSPARRIPAADAWHCPACSTANSSADTCCSMCHVCRP